VKVKFLVTPVGLMSGNIISAARLREALEREGVTVTDEKDERSYDLLHVHTPFPPGNALEVRRAKHAGIPVIMHTHTTAEDAEGTWTGSGVLSGWVGRYLNAFYNMADLVLSPSEWTKARLRARGLKAPVEVLSNGIDLGEFSFDGAKRARFRDRIGLSEGRKTVYLVGVVCLKKGVEVIPKVARLLPDLDFVWVGRRSNLYHPVKVRRAISLCTPNVRFVGGIGDVLEAHCGGDVFFAPSFAENQGIAVMEAMAVGRPVVARRLPVYEGLLEDGRNALLGESPEDFAGALERAANDEPLARSMASRARNSLEGHDMAKVAGRLVSFYDSLLERKSF